MQIKVKDGIKRYDYFTKFYTDIDKAVKHIKLETKNNEDAKNIIISWFCLPSV